MQSYGNEVKKSLATIGKARIKVKGGRCIIIIENPIVKGDNMRRYILTAAVISALLGFCAASFAADMATEFSASFIEKDAGAEQKGKVYIAGDMSRYEIAGSNEIVVTREDKKVIWLIFPKLRRYVEQEYIGAPKQNLSSPQEIDTGDLSREFIGHEMVDSYRLKKFLVTVKYNKGETKDQYYEWYRDNFPVPVKTQSLDGRTSYEYTNIKLGRPNMELFAEPKGYKKVTIEEIDAMEAAGKNKGKSETVGKSADVVKG
ncbi:MAG: hypothetical protein LLF78_01780 [Synergistaceae bacterium]|nr:hypothetical protein [Synergistaceae bacterium]